jgi:hypothetical protein
LHVLHFAHLLRVGNCGKYKHGKYYDMFFHSGCRLL